MLKDTFEVSEEPEPVRETYHPEPVIVPKFLGDEVTDACEAAVSRDEAKEAGMGLALDGP
jgi:hypothetical protein